jgi:hypothetical protein
MKLALILFGSSKRQYMHCSGVPVNIDYRKSYENYKTYIYTYFEARGYAIDVFLCTNDMLADEKAELVRLYNPVACTFLSDESIMATGPATYNRDLACRNARFCGAIEACLRSKIAYDVVLATRFDLLFQKEFTDESFDLTSFNLVSRLERPAFVCDNFYLFPYGYLNGLAAHVKEMLHWSFHDFEPTLAAISGKPVHFICNENDWIPHLSFYKIVRDW